ncbi:zeta toxin family protein [Pasteurella multocida]
MKSNEDILKILAKYNLESDVSKKFTKVWGQLSANQALTPQDNPVGVLLGGQPGAGKSFATLAIQERLNNNVLVINGDEFRSLHKHYDDFYQLYGKDASKYTGAFAGRMVEKVRDEAIKHRFNVVIEGTFRTTETPLKELTNFKGQGYKSEVIVCTCPKELSWESTIKRAEELEKAGLQPRYVPKEHHDKVTQNLASNTETIFSSGLVSHLEIYSREEKLFDSVNGNIDDIQTVINTELNKKLSLEKDRKIDTQGLFIDKLSNVSQLDYVEPISAKKLLQVDADLSQTQQLTKTKKLKR